MVRSLPEASQIGPLILGFDNHASSRRALTYAMQLAARLDVVLHVLHVVASEDYPIDPDSSSWEQQMQEHERLLSDRVRTLVTLPRDQWTYEIVRGDPWHTLLTQAEAEDAWLIVVGQHTHAHLIGGAISRLLGGGSHGGAVPTNLIRRGDRPVLVVPSRDDD